jgi:CMP-N-acetylneuraminic acid synthetase
LASDYATTASVVQYELTRTSEETGQVFDNILLLQPTAPLRKVSHVDAAMDRYLQSGATSLVSVCDVGGFHPDCMYRQIEGFLEKLTPSRPGVRRQNFEPLYIRNGAIYIVSVEYFIQTGQLVSENPAYYQMDRSDSINIDEPNDLSFAEVLINNGN